MRRSSRLPGQEISNWFFSDEDLREAINNIVDIPPKLRKPRKPVARETRVQTITHNAVLEVQINGKD